MRVLTAAVAAIAVVSSVVPTNFAAAAVAPVPQPVAPVTTEIPLDDALAEAAGEQSGVAAPATPTPTAVPAEPGPATTVPPVTGLPGPVTISADVDGTFSAIGFRYDAAAAPGIEVRVRENGTWSQWQSLGLPDGGPDAGSPDAAHAAARAPKPTTEPLLATAADGFQVRVTPTAGVLPTGLTAVTIDPGSSPYDAVATADQAPSAAAAAIGTKFPAPAPAILSRAQWGADESIRTADPDCVNPRYESTVKVGFVHHTASTNSYDQASALANIRSIYAYDAQVLGWCDIAYNFLVDKYGRIFEGRFGGVDRPVRGTHTGGFNTDTFAVSALGNYQEVAPTAVMVQSIAHVLGWKLGMYNRPIYGQSTLVSQGGGTSKYAAGVAVTFNNISGHRDPGATLCPGQYLYDRLGDIRTLANIVASQTYTTISGVSPPESWYVYGGGPAWFSAFVPNSNRWTVTITEECTGRVVRQYTGYTERGTLQLGWDLKDSGGGWVRGGVYRWHLRTAAGGAADGRVNVVPPESTATAAQFTGGISGAGFVPISPVRAYDSRKGNTQPLSQHSSRAITVRGLGQVPTSGVAGVALNVTAVCAAESSYLQVWPTGGTAPSTSVSNYSNLDPVPALVVAPLGSDGTVTLYNAAGSVHLIVDVVGYFPTTGGSTLKEVPAARILDGWASPMTANEARTLSVASALGVSASAVTGAVVNVTVVDTAGVGYVQLSPGAASTTATSTVNYAPGRTVANRAMVGVQNGRLTVTNGGTRARVIVDVVGYFTGDGSGARYTSVAPARVLDTRIGLGASANLGPKQRLTIPIAGTAGIPSNASAVLGTLTSDAASTVSYLTAWPAGTAMPPTSDLNPAPGAPRANAILAWPGTGGGLTVYNSAGTGAVLLDLIGYFR